MARNRQRAKERQAERRAAREAAGKEPRQTPGEDTGEVVNADLGGAPSPLLGQSGFTLAHTPEDEEFIGDLQVGDDHISAEDFAEEDLPAQDDTAAGPRGVRGGREQEEHEHHERGRLMGFLHAVWLELQRVQWPDRPTLTSLTGVTLMFVLIVGGYLGLLDAIFSKLVSAIL
jgi:preprotein translocase subunit SecE